MTRTPRRLALTGLVVLLLSACGDGQVRPGAAAVVGEERISADSLQQIVERSLADPQVLEANNVDRVGFQRLVLGRLIGAQLLQKAAADKGVEATEGEIDAKLEAFAAEAGGRAELEQQAVQSGVALQDLRPAVRDLVLQEQLFDVLTRDLPVPADQLQAAYAANIAKYDQVKSRHILVADETQAQAILGQVRAEPGRFAELAAELSTDESSKTAGGELPVSGRGVFVPEFEQVLFTAPPGSIELVQTQFGFHVIQVLERKTTSLAEATPELRATLLAEQGEELSSELLKSTAKNLGVTVNPRFGKWDAVLGKVVEKPGAGGALTPAPVEPGPEQNPGPAQNPAQPRAPQQQDPGQPAPGQAPQNPAAPNPAPSPAR